MKNKLIIPTLNILVYILCSILIGFIAPITISIIASISKNVQFSNCVETVPFWIFSILFTICAAAYLHYENEPKLEV